MNNDDILLRDVHPSDLPVFFEQQPSDEVEEIIMVLGAS
jgi:hypothetical protein